MLSGASRIRIAPGSLLHEIYRQTEVEEAYFCNYEVNPRYESEYEWTGLKVVARGSQNEIRAIELGQRSFFLATLFQPQLSSSTQWAHPVINAFLKAVLQFAKGLKAAAPEKLDTKR